MPQTQKQKKTKNEKTKNLVVLKNTWFARTKKRGPKKTSDLNKREEETKKEVANW